MIAFLTQCFIAFGWLLFISFGMFLIWWLDSKNYWMPPVYIGWSILLFIVTMWVNYIS